MLRLSRFNWRTIIGIIVLISVAGFAYRPLLADIVGLLWTPREIAGEQLQFSERTLIVAPHPDDESLGGAGLIIKALAARKKVLVVIMNSGDGYRSAVIKNYGIEAPQPQDFRRLGEARHLESLQAMKRLGLSERDVVFLGYPDGGTNGLWEVDWDYDKLHASLNGRTSSPYAFSYEKEAPYCGANVVKNLSEIIQTFKPSDILYPDPNDQHHDHWATNAFVKYVLIKQDFQGREWTYLVHRGDFPTPWEYYPYLPLHPPVVLQNLDTSWFTLSMNEQEKTIKLQAIEQYTTQIKVMGRFLKAFIRENELLGKYVDPVLPISQTPLELKRGSKFPYAQFRDAYADNIRTEIAPEADIITVGGVRIANQLYLGVETQGSISPSIKYNIRVRLFRPEGEQRLDLTITDSVVSAKRLASNSLLLPPKVAVTTQEHQLWLAMPSDILDGTTGLFLSVDTYKNKKRIDKTAWRLLKVQPTRPL